MAEGEGKSKMVTLALCVFAGYFGAHRFYTGHTVPGAIQLFTGGGCGLWTMYDLIMIVLGKYKDADGNDLVS